MRSTSSAFSAKSSGRRSVKKGCRGLGREIPLPDSYGMNLLRQVYSIVLCAEGQHITGETRMGFACFIRMGQRIRVNQLAPAAVTASAAEEQEQDDPHAAVVAVVEQTLAASAAGRKQQDQDQASAVSTAKKIAEPVVAFTTTSTVCCC